MFAVLLVEDHPSLSLSVKRLLEGLGLSVISISKIKELREPNCVVAIMADQEDVVELDLSTLDIRVALIDFSLGKDSLTGDRLIPMLLGLGVFCLGIGDQEGGQHIQLKKGAHLTLRLKVTLAMAIHGQLAPADYRWPEGFDGDKDAVLKTLRELLTPSS